MIKFSPRQLSGVIALAALAGGRSGAGRSRRTRRRVERRRLGDVRLRCQGKGQVPRELQPTLQVQLYGQRAMRDAVRQRVANGQRARWREQLSRQLL